MSEAKAALRAPDVGLPEEPRPARIPEAPVDPIFVARRSTRAFSEEPVAAETLRTVLEAARWSPSSANLQPWVFVYAESPEGRAALLGGLVEANRRWAASAPALLFLFARTGTPKGEPNRFAEFDAGAAWMSLALQAHLLGLSAHAMGGVDRDRMSAIAGLDPAEFRPVAAIALGYPAPPEQVPEALRPSERPSDRRPFSEIAFRVPLPLTG